MGGRGEEGLWTFDLDVYENTYSWKVTDKNHIFHFQILRKSFFMIMKGFIVYPGNITLGFRPFYQKKLFY